MAGHDCINIKRLDDLEKTVFGNGKPGLKEMFIRQDESIKSLNENTDKLATSVSALVKFMSEIRGANKMRTTITWLIGIIITLGLAYIGTVVTIAIGN